MLSLTHRIPADAHEGPVYVPAQRRLYFATAPSQRGPGARVELKYWDLEASIIDTWLYDARMANGVALSCDASCLLVCEQGDRERPAAIARYRLSDKHRTQVVADFEGQPFNSPNKVAELSTGVILFTDPDYGRRQRFRPTRVPTERTEGGAFLSPEEMAARYRPDDALPPATYVLAGGVLRKLDTGLEQPHGLAVSPDERYLYISDTSADDGVGGFDESRRHDVYRYALDAGTGDLSMRRHLASVPVGIPDGMVCDEQGRLFCAVGDGIRVYDAEGARLHHELIDGGAVNLFLDCATRQLFVTTDEDIRVYALAR